VAGIADSDAEQREALLELQESLLRSVLEGRPLPGREQAFAFPDRGFLLQQPELLLADENLAPGLSLEGLRPPLRVVPAGQLGAGGDAVYLRFGPAEGDDQRLQLTLEAGIAATGERRAAGLSAVRVGFRRDGGAWVADGDPVMWAS
jgi:hypothetical protein